MRLRHLSVLGWLAAGLACGPSQQDWSRLLRENEQLEQQHAALVVRRQDAGATGRRARAERRGAESRGNGGSGSWHVAQPIRVDFGCSALHYAALLTRARIDRGPVADHAPETESFLGVF
jgi:hypothetical protein